MNKYMQLFTICIIGIVIICLWKKNAYNEKCLPEKKRDFQSGLLQNVLTNMAKNASLNFDFVKPYASCPMHLPIERIGASGDGGKWICGSSKLKAPCTVVSLGSAMDFSFEEAIILKTECVVHTFDCTVSGKSIDDRHFFHSLCLGKKGKSYVDFRKLLEITKSKKIDILKMDIEGHEYDIFADWNDVNLIPKQVAVELHHYVPATINNKTVLNWVHEPSHAFISIVFMHLASLGYIPVHSEPNSVCCSEYTFIHDSLFQGF